LRITGDDAFVTLSDFLRRHQRLTGTKVVCAEGDCGSCTALIGRVERDRLVYSSVTSCIQLMFQLDATHVVTVEGLTNGRELNPIQQSLVACQGTQCGFCTPGFVVALYDLMQDGRRPNDHAVRRGLVGNLCRCTGYESIVRSALKVDAARIETIDNLYPRESLVADLAEAAREDVLIEAPPRLFFKPATLEQALRFRAGHPEALIVSGGTDIGVQVNKRVRALTTTMSTSALSALNTIDVNSTSLRIGAGATLSALERAATTHLPELAQFLAWFGSPLIKNAGTLAGNLANASPIGDMIPALYALAADIELTSVAGSRRLPIENFYTAYRQTALRPEELITFVHIPLPRPGEIYKLYKISRRKDLDISSFNAAIWLRRSASTIHDIRIAYGGVGAMVLRMRNTENSLQGQPTTLDSFERAAQIARDEVTPITDVRGSETYRRTLAANILLKFWHETLSGAGNGDGESDWPPSTPPPTRQPIHQS
jgi:xanthine dehydrogenase small subunit